MCVERRLKQCITWQLSKPNEKKPVFADEGHMYRFDRRSADNGKFWRCLVDGCNGRIKTDANDVFIEFRNTELN